MDNGPQRPVPPRTVTISLDSPDPRPALNAFLWALDAARKIGFCPKTEHVLIEHLVREDASVIYYSSAGSIVSIVEGKNADPSEFDDTMEVIELIAKRKKRQREAREAAALVERASIAPPAPEQSDA